MLLRNYDNRVFMHKIPYSSSATLGTTESFGDGYLNVKDISGTIRKFYPRSTNARSSTLPLTTFIFPTSGYPEYYSDGSNTHVGYFNLLKCGSGTTPVTYDDYKMASAFNSQQTTYVGGSVTTGDYDPLTDTVTSTVSCTCFAVTDLAINEVGVYTGNSYDSSNRAIILTYRDVLPETVNVPANGTYTVSLTITVSGVNPNKPANYAVSVSVD